MGGARGGKPRESLSVDPSTPGSGWEEDGEGALRPVGVRRPWAAGPVAGSVPNRVGEPVLAVWPGYTSAGAPPLWSPLPDRSPAPSAAQSQSGVRGQRWLQGLAGEGRADRAALRVLLAVCRI